MRNQQDIEQDIVRGIRAAFQKAAVIQVFLQIIRFGVAVIASFTVFIFNGAIAYVGSVITLALAVSWFVLNYAYRECRSQGEWARRLNLVTVGLGGALPDGAIKEIERLPALAEGDNEKGGTQFWTTTTSPGNQRLVEMLDQVSHTSSNMYHQSKKFALRASIALSAVIWLPALLSLAVVDADNTVRVLRAFSAIFTIFIIPEAFFTVAAFCSAASKVDNISNRLKSLRKHNAYPEAEVLLLFGDYNSTVEGAPIFYPWIMKKYARRFREYYHEAYKRDETMSTTPPV